MTDVLSLPSFHFQFYFFKLLQFFTAVHVHVLLLLLLQRGENMRDLAKIRRYLIASHTASERKSPNRSTISRRELHVNRSSRYKQNGASLAVPQPNDNSKSWLADSSRLEVGLSWSIRRQSPTLHEFPTSSNEARSKMKNWGSSKDGLIWATEMQATGFGPFRSSPS